MDSYTSKDRKVHGKERSEMKSSKAPGKRETERNLDQDKDGGNRRKN